MGAHEFGYGSYEDSLQLFLNYFKLIMISLHLPLRVMANTAI
jgi:hypothetical protein